MTDLDLDRLEALANQKRGRGYHEEQILVGAVPPLVAEVRRLAEQTATTKAEALREAAEAIDLSDGRHRQDCPPHMFHHERVAETWLRDRAAKLERK